MKRCRKSQSRSSPLLTLIEGATGASKSDLGTIENIMREEIFHSTLDWQSRKELEDAARQAFARLIQNRELYDRDRACKIAMFQKMRAESALAENDTSSNRAAFALAEKRHQTLRARLLVWLDEQPSH